MAKCIYCKEDKILSEEDYFPKCLGTFKGLVKLKDKICGDCNSKKFSQLEEEFSRCSPEAFYRWIHGIRGRKGHTKRNPFYGRSMGNPPIKITTTHPTLGIRIFCEVPFGSLKQQEVLTAYLARQFIVKDRDNKLHAVLVTDDIKEACDLERAIGQFGLKDVDFFDAVIPEEDSELMERIGSIFPVKIEEKGIACNNFQKSRQEFNMEFQFTSKYFRAIAKIAFHFFLKFFNEYSGLENEFDGIKSFIADGAKPDNWVQRMDKSFIYDLNHFSVNMPCSHFVAVEKNEYEITAKLQFFVFPGKDPTEHYHVFLGKNPHKIIHRDSKFYQFEYFDSQDSEGFDGIMKVSPSVSKAFLNVLGFKNIQ